MAGLCALLRMNGRARHVMRGNDEQQLKLLTSNPPEPFVELLYQDTHLLTFFETQLSSYVLRKSWPAITPSLKPTAARTQAAHRHQPILTTMHIPLTSRISPSRPSLSTPTTPSTKTSMSLLLYTSPPHSATPQTPTNSSENET